MHEAFTSVDGKLKNKRVLLIAPDETRFDYYPLFSS
jgi:hypothetical protein